jgi:hypothetical protein
MGRETYKGATEGSQFDWRDWVIDGLLVVAIIVAGTVVDHFM